MSFLTFRDFYDLAVFAKDFCEICVCKVFASFGWVCLSKCEGLMDFNLRLELIGMF